jgi:hypothetical protein
MVVPQAGEHGVWVGEITECTSLPLASFEKLDANVKCTLKKKERLAVCL